MAQRPVFIERLSDSLSVSLTLSPVERFGGDFTAHYVMSTSVSESHQGPASGLWQLQSHMDGNTESR